MNNNLIEDYQEKSDTVKDRIGKFKKVPIHLSRIIKDGRSFMCDGNLVQHTALNDLLGIFSIKYDLLGEIHDDEKQWIPLQKCLSNIKNDKIVTGIVKQERGNQIITRFFQEEIEKEKHLNFNHGFDLVENYLKEINSNFKLHNIRFNEYSLCVESTFRNLTNQIDVFGDGNDVWDTGFNFTYGLYKTIISPFFLRLVCTNGMTSTHTTSRRYFSLKGLRQKSFNRLVEKTVTKDLKQEAILSCNLMRNHNASLREYFNARNECLRVSKELADTYFNDEHIQRAYEPYRLRYKNNRWLSTANSNMNSYEFFNRITHCTTHQTCLPDATRANLNIQASEMFFKGPDLSFQAPNPFLK